MEKLEKRSFIGSSQFKEAMYLFGLPVFILACFAFVRLIFPVFMAEVSVVFMAVIFSVVIVNKGVYRPRIDPKVIFRNLLIISTGGFLLILSAHTYHFEQNDFSPGAWMILCMVLIAGALFLFDHINIDWFEEIKSYGVKVKILSVFFVVIMGVQMYVYFGSNIIWFPAIATIFFSIFFFSNPEVEGYLRSYQKPCELSAVFLPLCVAMISTLL